MNLDATAAFLEQNGEAIAIRRITGPRTWMEVLCKARVSAYQPDEMLGGIVQGDRKVILSNREIEDAKWPGPPRVGDQVILLDQAGLSARVTAAFSSGAFGETARHTLTIRGS